MGEGEPHVDAAGRAWVEADPLQPAGGGSGQPAGEMMWFRCLFKLIGFCLLTKSNTDSTQS